MAAITTLLLFTGLAFEVMLVVMLIVERPRTVDCIPIPGHPTASVDFVRCRAMNGERGYIARFSNGAETKEPLVPIEVSVEELRISTRVRYDGHTLEVTGPRGAKVSIAGYVP